MGGVVSDYSIARSVNQQVGWFSLHRVNMRIQVKANTSLFSKLAMVMIAYMGFGTIGHTMAPPPLCFSATHPRNAELIISVLG